MNNVRFANLLYRKFISPGETGISVVDIANRLGEDPATFYKYCSAGRTFPPEKVGLLYNATGDIEFVETILDGTHLEAIKRLEPNAGEQRGLEKETIDIMTAVGTVTGDIQKAHEDGRLSDIERRRIERDLNQAIRELEDVRQLVLHGQTVDAKRRG